MQPFRPTYTQQMTNNKPIWQVPTYFRPNQHKHTPNYNKTQNHQTGHFSENTYPQLQEPSTSKNTNFPITKRLRPSDSEQTNISISEMRFQDAHAFQQFKPNYYKQRYYDHNQYNPCQNHGCIN